MRHIHRKDIDPHLDLTLTHKHTPTDTRQKPVCKRRPTFLNIKRLKEKLGLTGERFHGGGRYLIHAGAGLAEQGSGLNVLRHQFGPHGRDLGPAVEYF